MVGGVALLGKPDLAARVGGDEQAIFVVIAGMGFIWLALGLLTCLKQMWAVYVALVLSYMSLVSQVLNLNLSGSVILTFVVLQAHRVIGWANQMRAAGVPLTTLPPPRMNRERRCRHKPGG